MCPPPLPLFLLLSTISISGKDDRLLLHAIVIYVCGCNIRVFIKINSLPLPLLPPPSPFLTVYIKYSSHHYILCLIISPFSTSATIIPSYSCYYFSSSFNFLSSLLHLPPLPSLLASSSSIRHASGSDHYMYICIYIYVYI